MTQDDETANSAPSEFRTVNLTRPALARVLGISVRKVAKMEKRLKRRGEAFRTSDGSCLLMRLEEDDHNGAAPRPKTPRGKPR